MRVLTRTALLALIIAGLSSLCPAQSGDRTFEPPPPPATAVEYNTSNWKTFSPTPGFMISMPGKPTGSTREIDSPFGRLKQHDHLLTTETGSYRVSYFVLPNAPGDSDSIKKALEAARDDLIYRNREMKLLKEQEIKINRFITARELLLGDGKSTLHLRLFIVENRFYQIALAVPYRAAFGTGRPGDDPYALTDFYRTITARFFDSIGMYGGGSADKAGADNSSGSGRRKVVSGGVLNGRAISLPKPSYPDEARLRRITGSVVVQVMIDETGKVISAKAVSGQPELQEAATKAALKARFSPVKLEGEAVKVTGVVVYNFAL